MWETPPLASFTAPSGAEAVVPTEANQKCLAVPEAAHSLGSLQTWWGEAAVGRREALSEKTPLRAAFIQNAFPNVSLWPVEALLLTALFIHDRQLINSRTS